jgi:type 1 glutamine amidotransferase
MFSLGALFTAALASTVAFAKPNPAAAPVSPRVLVFTKTEGFRHDSIPTAIEQLRKYGPEYNLLFDFSEDAGIFSDANMTAYDGVLFVSTSETILDPDQQGVFTKWLQSGGVYSGVHLACGTQQNMTAYKAAVGALFEYHPEQQEATFSPLTKDHPATADMPDQWTYSEEVYFYQSDPREMGATVLVTVDKTKLNNPTENPDEPPRSGTPHPIAWYIEKPQYNFLVQGAPKHGRSFYTSLGHTNEVWMTDTFMFHLLGGLTWALDGASTRAYQTGIIGNNTTPPPPPPPKPEDNTTNSAANGSGLHKSAASPSMAAAGVVGGALALGLTLLF